MEVNGYKIGRGENLTGANFHIGWTMNSDWIQSQLDFVVTIIAISVLVAV